MFIVGAGVETSILQATRTTAFLSFSGLSADERNHLREWHAAARTIGIDGIEDLASRPWPCTIEGTVIGVYRAGSESAGWLVIGHDAAWVVAQCAEGTISDPFHSLAEALASVYPGRKGQGRPSLLFSD